MQETINSSLLPSLLKALRPIARLLMKVGVGYREFAEMSKCAFVDVATSDYGLRGRPTNISRVAVMTGLTRKEVKRLRDKISAGTSSQALRRIPPAEILERWHSDPDFVNSNGKPLVLQFDGAFPSFSDLVKKYGGDIPPGAMRTELKRVGAIEESKDGTLRAIKSYFRPVDETRQLERALCQSIFGLALAINRNLDEAPQDQWTQRVVFSTKIKQNDAPRVRRISQERAAEFIESIDDLFAAYETILGDEDAGSESTAVGVGIYYFEDASIEGGPYTANHA